MTTTNIYIASPEGANGRNVVAYGVLKALTTKFKTTVFRPAVSNHDHFTPILLNASNAGLGVAIAPAAAVNLAAHNHLHVKRIDEPSLETRLAAIWPRSRYLSAVAKHFLQSF